MHTGVTDCGVGRRQHGLAPYPAQSDGEPQVWVQIADPVRSRKVQVRPGWHMPEQGCPLPGSVETSAAAASTGRASTVPASGGASTWIVAGTARPEATSVPFQPV